MADKYMEIDFMILWKQKIQDKTRMLEKVQGMIKACFPDSTEKTIHYKENEDNIHYLSYYIACNDDKVVYLKIKCDKSPLKSAQILSAVRDRLYGGKHRSCFLMICTYDDASLYFCCSLMKPFGVFERRLRQLICITIIKTENYAWVENTIPTETLDSIKAKMKLDKKGENHKKIIEYALEYLDYSEMSDYLFGERRDVDIDELLDIKLSDKKVDQLSKEELIRLIRSTRKESLWNKFFKDNKDLIITRETIDELRKYRNDIMHHHSMNQETFKYVKKTIRQLNKQLNVAISNIENKQYTAKEKTYVHTRFVSSISNAVQSIQTALSPIIEAANRNAKIMETYQKAMDYEQAFAPLMEVANRNAKVIEAYQKAAELERILAPLQKTINAITQAFPQTNI